MSTSPFKAFIPYMTGTVRLDSDLEPLAAKDPSGSSWRSMGFVPPIPGEDQLIVSTDVGKMLCVQINERILPGKVRDEELKKRLSKLEAQEGRKPSKKEYAELRDQTEFDLLPRAFVRRSNVYVAFVKGPVPMGHTTMLVFTSSQKKADDIVTLLLMALGENLKPQQFETAESMPSVLTGAVVGDYDTAGQWEPGRSAVLKGSAKRTVRVKDADIADSRIVALIKDGYAIHEMSIEHGDEQQHSFVVNDNLCFKRVEIGGVKDTGDFYGDAMVRLTHIRSLVNDFFASPEDGGMVSLSTAFANAADDDEEL